MPYYYCKAQSTVARYSTDKEARTLLYRTHTQLALRKVTLIDYLLLPYSLELILYSTKRLKGPILLSPVSLLVMFAHLSRVEGAQYSGLYELYHKSHCFAQVGKSGTDLPYCLETIIAVKECPSALTVLGDEPPDTLNGDHYRLFSAVVDGIA